MTVRRCLWFFLTCQVTSVIWIVPSVSISSLVLVRSYPSCYFEFINQGIKRYNAICGSFFPPLKFVVLNVSWGLFVCLFFFYIFLSPKRSNIATGVGCWLEIKHLLLAKNNKSKTNKSWCRSPNVGPQALSSGRVGRSGSRWQVEKHLRPDEGHLARGTQWYDS